MMWYNYLFYDTGISVEGTISSNFGLPLLPGKLEVKNSKYYIKVNSIIYGLVEKLYSGEHSNLETLDKEMMRARDVSLLERAIKAEVPGEELADLDSKIATLVQIRIQKFEIEGETDPWISRIQRLIEGAQVLETENGKRDLKDEMENDEGKLNIPTDGPGIQRHEFIDSDSDSENQQRDELQNDKFKQTLSRIEEERTDQLQPSTYNDAPDEKSPSFNSNIGSSAAKKKMGTTRFRNEPLNTAGTDVRSQTDYITQDNAMKNYIQKTLMAGLSDKLRKAAMKPENNQHQYDINAHNFGSAELEKVIKKLDIRMPELNTHSMGVIPPNPSLPIPLNEEEYYIGKKFDAFTPTLFKRKVEPKQAKIIEEDCSMSSEENRSQMEQKSPHNAT